MGWSFAGVCLQALAAGQSDITTLPAAEDLTFSLDNLSLTGPSQDLPLLAGEVFTELRLAAASADFDAALQAALCVVQADAQPSVSGCSGRPQGLGFSGNALQLAVADGDLVAQNFAFMQGGVYRLCYSSDGSFSAATSSLVPVPYELRVTGARLDCGFDRCLEEFPWRCFTYPDEPAPAHSCVVRVDALELVAATQARLSWGAIGSCDSSDSWALAPAPLEPALGSQGREFHLQALASEAFSVQTCLCPGYDDGDGSSCNHAGEFLQRLGRAIFYQARTCEDGLCSMVYASVLPSSPFTLRLDCGGAFCSGNGSIRIIDHSAIGANDRPSWQPSAGCRLAASSTQHWMSGQRSGTEEVELFGGLALGPGFTSGFPTSQWFDVCYCDSQCEGPSSGAAFAANEFGFYKVGRIRVSPLRPLANVSSAAAAVVAGLPGQLLFEGSNIPLAPPAQIKLLWDGDRVVTSLQCSALVGQVTFANSTSGPFCSSQDSCNYRASQHSGAVVFNDGGGLGEMTRFPSAGIVAVCYCGVLSDDGSCLRESRSYWILAGLMLVRGPCVLSSGLCQESSWSFPVGLTFRLELQGLGLRSTDKLRIINVSGDCSASGDGDGEPTVFKGCPADCTPLDRPDTYLYGGGFGKDDIDLRIDSSDGHSCNEQNEECGTSKVIEILTSPDYVDLRFDSDPGLQTGDFVVLDAVSGGTEEENDLVSGQLGLDRVGHPVTRLTEAAAGAAGAAGLLYRIFVALPGQRPTFSPGAGGWRRHNMARTKQELKATEAKFELQVCWGSGPDTYHVRAGRVSFLQPGTMEANLYLTSLEGAQPAPLVLSFRTALEGVASRYRQAQQSMRLRISFHDVGLLEPRLADAGASIFAVPSDRDSLEEASQSVCGVFFLELWSSDAKGFPLPKGCYFGASQGAEREMNVIFDPKNGLELDSNYQIVLNAIVASGSTPADKVVSVWSLDELQNQPYGVVEVGDARLATAPRSSSAVGEPRFAANGFELLSTGFDRLVELHGNSQVLFRLGGEVQSPIRSGAVLRIFFQPLTVWDLPLCQATCFPHYSLQCGYIASCATEAVLPGGRRNIVKLALPTEMTEIAGSISHTVRVSQLTLPPQGFFGTRLLAQVSLSDDSRVHFTESSGVFLWKAPAASAGLAGVVTVEGDGNQRPFRGQTENVLYMQLALGATLFAELQDGDASFTLRPPPGYSCVAAGAAPNSLGFLGVAVPQGRGSLEAAWTLSTCTYSLKAGQLIPAGTRVLVALTVNQPETALPSDGLVNRWYLQLRSKGRYRVQTQEPAATSFTQADGIGRGVAVLGRLQQSLQPSSFAAGAAVTLFVFFKPEQSSGYGGQVLVSAPEGFDFAPCLVQSLPEIYYRIGNDKQDTADLPGVQSCVSFCKGCEGPANTVRITLANPLLPEFFYGFQLSIRNSDTFADEAGWQIVTRDPLDRALDAAFPNAQLNPATGGTGPVLGWGVFQQGSATSSVAMSSLRPSAVTGALALLTLLVQVPLSFTASCRLIAPVGFELETTTFQSQSTAVPGSTADWPGGTPFQTGSTLYDDQPPNAMLWMPATYSSGRVYGFAVGISIPRFPVATMLSAFLLQFGWEAATLEERPLALVLHAEKVQTIVNFRVDYTSNVVGSGQRISVTLETMSDIPVGGRLVLSAPAVFAFQSLCSVLAVPGEPSSGLETMNCEAEDGTVTLRPQNSFLAAGVISFALDVWNPAEPLSSRSGHNTACGSESCWQVQIFDALGADLDAPAYVASFPVNQQMPHAQLVDLNSAQRLATGRNDRPGQINKLIFAFRLALRVSSLAALRLAGPHGFAFAEDCLPGLTTAAEDVFGSGLAGFAAWERTAKVQSCAGRGARATLVLQMGLRPERLYGFRVTVTNPLELPDPNSWSLEYGRESALPFASFTPWTFTDISLTPTLRAISDDALPNPVTLRFRPHKEVKGDPTGAGTGGMLQVAPAPGFRAAARGTACEDFVLLDVGAAVFFQPEEVSCLADSAANGGTGTLSFIFTDARKLDPGRLYELVLQVVNPSQIPSAVSTWTVWTFSNSSGSLEVALDRTSFPGFQLNLRLETWQVAAPSERHAGRSAPVDFQLALGGSWLPGAQLLIRAPQGFDLTSPPDCAPQLGGVLGGQSTTVGRSSSLQACALQVWQEVAEAEAATWRIWDGACSGHKEIGSLDLCEDDCSDVIYQVCNLQVTSGVCHNFGYRATAIAAVPSCSKEQLRLVLGQGDQIAGLLHFELEVKNPMSNPGLVDRYWVAEVYPPDGGVMSAATVAWRVIPELTESRVRLLGPLLASGSLSTLEVQFSSPVMGDAVRLDALSFGFNFSAAVASDAGASPLAVLGSSVDSVTVGVHVTGTSTLQLSSVQLGVGAAHFAVTVLLEGLESAEDLNVSESASFEVPGRILVTRSDLQPAGDFADVGSALPRRGDPAWATFGLRVTAAAGDTLHVSGPPFTFTGDVQLQGENEAEVQLVSLANATVLFLTLQEPLDGLYELRAAVLAGPEADNGERWSFELWPEQSQASQELPKATNDASLGSFSLVEVVQLGISAGRVAPQSSAELEISVATSAQPREILLFAPLGFVFPENCLRDTLTVTSQVLSCRRSQPNVASLLIGTMQGGISTTLVATAPQSSSGRWFVRAMAEGAEVGWGTAPGFDVAQMEAADLIYAGVPSSAVHVAVSFRTSQTLMGGGNIEVVAPAVYGLSCLAADGFNALFLPGLGACDSSQGLLLTLNQTLAPGSYAFMAGMRTPAFTPSENLFDLLLRDVQGKVLDAKVGIPGQRIVHGLSLNPPQLQFSSSEQGVETEIRVVLRVAETLDPLQALGPVRALQIAVPERFTLIVKEPVVNLDGLPTPEVGWYHLYFLEKLVRVDLVANPGVQPPQLPAGDYRLAFKVRLPEFWMPSVNVWLLSLCRDLLCSDLIATVPVAGFKFGDAPMVQVETPVEPGGRAGGRALSTLILVLSPIFWVQSMVQS